MSLWAIPRSFPFKSCNLERIPSVSSRMNAISSCFGCFETIASSVASLRFSLTLTGLPNLTALTPNSRRPSSKLSTATLDSAQAKIGPLPISIKAFIRCTAVCVFPVPGGPWIIVSLCLTAVSIALC